MVKILHGYMLKPEFLKALFLVLLFFLICIKDLADNLAPNPQSFADDTPIFSVVRNMHASLLDLSNDLIKVFKWVFQLKKARKQSQ